jgi:CubicO group peptidase (beta-lactamase class C family)
MLKALKSLKIFVDGFRFGVCGISALAFHQRRYPDLLLPGSTQISLENTHIIDPPGQYFLYNKYHPQLLGMILERATGMSVTRLPAN